MRSVIISLLVLFSLASSAQRVEVNPNIKWSFVRSQELDMQSGRTYQFEFPGEKGYDYLANVQHENSSLMVSIGVFDIQYAPIRQKTDSTSHMNTDFNFKLTDNGTYIMVVTVVSKELEAVLPATISVVRRPIVAR
jgi:hypothetical protein